MASNPIPAAPAAISRTRAIEPPSAERAEGRGLPRQADADLQLKAAIVTQSLEVSLQTGNQPLALLYRTAIDRINERLAPEFGANAIQAAAEQDQTPEAVAGRIVSLSTGFFAAYQAQHPDDDPAKQLEDFMALIRKGFEQGFAEASAILDGLGVLQGEIADGIQRTYELVLKGYDEFVARQSGAGDAAPSAQPAA